MVNINPYKIAGTEIFQFDKYVTLIFIRCNRHYTLTPVTWYSIILKIMVKKFWIYKFSILRVSACVCAPAFIFMKPGVAYCLGYVIRACNICWRSCCGNNCNKIEKRKQKNYLSRGLNGKRCLYATKCLFCCSRYATRARPIIIIKPNLSSLLK